MIDIEFYEKRNKRQREREIAVTNSVRVREGMQSDGLEFCVGNDLWKRLCSESEVK